MTPETPCGVKIFAFDSFQSLFPIFSQKTTFGMWEYSTEDKETLLLFCYQFDFAVYLIRTYLSRKL
jgi:hypothetical protein